ncbi:dihydropyrimidine dehydrogenase [Acidobacteria bacterium ACD]|nr:dihydropyrimidine dehydrogenase [Acidobacteria bacterium ACD]
MKATSSPTFLTPAQLLSEMERCLFCEEKPCKEACPADCSPADFIMAARVGEPSDWRRAAGLILSENPLGGVCGAVCPDRHCMAACSRKTFDRPVLIPEIQAQVVENAKETGVMPAFRHAAPTGKKVAVVGAGPAGLGAAALLAQQGHAVTIFEAGDRPGGMCLLIPDSRLPKRVLFSDIDFLLGLGDIRLETHARVTEPVELRSAGFDAVLVTTGLDQPLTLGLRGEELAVPWARLLFDPPSARLKGKTVAVIGGGAVAVDCAVTARSRGAARVELFALESLSEMPLTAKERKELLDAGVEVTGRTRVTEIRRKDGSVDGIVTLKVELPRGRKFHPSAVADVGGTRLVRPDVNAVVLAIGARPSARSRGKARFYAGDMENGPTTVVEAVAAGKNAATLVDAYLDGERKVLIQKRTKARVPLPGLVKTPVPLDADFFGRPIPSPFLLSAAPPTDGYDQMRKAYEAGWAGGVMKTAFDGLPIHIPARYMFAFTPATYGNCDNVSGHPLDRVRREVERLVTEFPDRLTLASTGGSVTGDDEADRRSWQSNTRKLESCGAMGIEYSLSCPQGGDGTKGDIVSQDAELTAKIVGWVLEAGRADVPKLFKLTGAVTAIRPIVAAVKAVLEKHPGKKAGVTLANTFPTLAFRKGEKPSWEEGVVVGMSGEGVAPISNLTLANVAGSGVTVSGNGGPMDYKAAAHFLALGASTVQFCTVVMKHGYGIVHDLHSGLSHLMADRGYRSVAELVGCALPHPVTGFMELPSKKPISAVDRDVCEHCGNCTRCPYLAISLDHELVPVTDPARCVGCSICAQKCFSGALFMRDRTPRELAALVEA